MTIALEAIGKNKIPSKDVFIEKISDSMYPQMAGLSELGKKKITMYPMTFTSPVYPTPERIYDFSPNSDNTSILMIVAHELTHAFAEEQDAYDSNKKLIYGK